MAASQGSSKGPWIIAGAIVLVGVIVILTLVILNGGNSGQSASPSPGVQTTLPTNPATPSPTHTRKPKPSTNPLSPLPSSSPSPQVNMELLLRQAAQTQANRDRPGEVKHVGFGGIFKNKSCPSKQQGIAVVRFTTSPTPGQYTYCWTGSRWTYQEGPTYGG